LQSLQLRRSKFRQDFGMNHFTTTSCQPEFVMKAWNRLKPILTGKTAVQVVMVIHHHAGNSGKMTNCKW
jgi:hypothetical protein